MIIMLAVTWLAIYAVLYVANAWIEYARIHWPRREKPVPGYETAPRIHAAAERAFKALG